MGMQPSSGIVGGTVLRIPAIQSPNFNLATMTGWAILQNGTAYFFDGVTAGEFVGTNYVISSAGAFFYNGTPGTGNLFLAIAPGSGTDPYGNVYFGGMTLFGNVPGAVLSFFSGGLADDSPSVIESYAVNDGTATEQEVLAIQGPNNTFELLSYAYMTMLSASKDGTIPAGGNLGYSAPGGVETSILSWGPAGVTFPNGPGQNMGTPAATGTDGTPSVGAVETRDAILGNYVFTAQAAHRYQVRYDDALLQGSVLADFFQVNIRDGGSSTPVATSALLASTRVVASIAGSPMASDVANTFTPTAGTHTLGIFTARQTGTGIGTPRGSRQLYVVDMGLA
jgi:hypothetical protein